MFVPDDGFAPGERVTIDAGMRVAGAQGDRSAFVVARHSTARPPRYDQAKPPQDRGVQIFASRPEADFSCGR